MMTMTGAPLPRMTEAQATSSPTMTACQMAGLRPDQQDRDGDHQHQREQGVGQDGGFQPDLPRVEQRRCGGQRRSPGGQPPGAQHRVDDRGQRDSHQVLQRGHEQQAVERLEHPQQHGIAGRAGLAQVEVGALLHIGERVLDEQRGLEPQRGDDPREHGHAGRDGEQPVVAPQRGRGQAGRRAPRRGGQATRLEGDLRRPELPVARPAGVPPPSVPPRGLVRRPVNDFPPPGI